MKTITANIPARTKTFGGKTHHYPARVDIYTQDEKGTWFADLCGDKISVFECEVIDACLKASNWKDIKNLHFPMHGFNN